MTITSFRAAAGTVGPPAEGDDGLQLTGESASGTLRRALRLLDRDARLRQARADP